MLLCLILIFMNMMIMIWSESWSWFRIEFECWSQLRLKSHDVNGKLVLEKKKKKSNSLKESNIYLYKSIEILKTRSSRALVNKNGIQKTWLKLIENCQSALDLCNYFNTRNIFEFSDIKSRESLTSFWFRWSSGDFWNIISNAINPTIYNLK